MCGVAGIFSYRQEAGPVSPEELVSIRDSMVHRGPDAKGIWIDEHNRIGLAHRRLSIIDLSNRSDQPMLSEDANFAISYNGEIYNYLELKKDLQQKGYTFKTESDTEVLLKLYQDKGESMCSYLRGMFAFIIWDKTKSQLIIARDSYGIKPLYYSDDGKSIRFASQVKALRASPVVSNEQQLSAGGIVGFLLYGSVPEPFTTYQNIKSLPAGTLLIVSDNGLSFQKYFSLCNTYQELYVSKSPEDVAKTAEDALRDTVKAHTIADVPVGIFLSSGLDSCSLLALMHHVGYQDIHSMTLSFKEFVGTNNDEAPLAEEIATRYNVNHRSHCISQEDFETHLPTILNDMDQPTIDGVNTWFVSKSVKDVGLKVAISGLGGDELFGGYPSFKNIPRMIQLKKTTGWLPGFSQMYHFLMTNLAKIKKFNKKTAEITQYYNNIYQAYLLQRSIFFPWEIERILGRDMTVQGLSELDNENYNMNHLNDCPKEDFAMISALETNLYMKNQLLRDSDWAGMAHSIEIRVPLVDTQLLRTLGPAILQQEKYRNKSILAESSLSSDDIELLKRNKTGFGLPLQDWFKSTHNVFTNNYNEVNNDEIHWSKKYALHVLDKFHGHVFQ